MNALQIFNYDRAEVRTAIIDSDPWFIAADVCNILGLSNPSESIKALDDDEKSTLRVSEGGPEANIISEAGLYSLVIRSNKPEAKAFKRWITHEVIPQIRKTGSFSLMPQTYADALRQLADTVEEREKLKEQNLLMAPKAEFFDAVASSKTAIPIGNAAKVLEIKGVGRNKLFEILRQQKILMHDNVPYQEYIDRGYFRTVEQKYTTPDGETKISIKTLVYQRGLDYIRKTIAKGA